MFARNTSGKNSNFEPPGDLGSINRETALCAAARCESIIDNPKLNTGGVGRTERARDSSFISSRGPNEMRARDVFDVAFFVTQSAPDIFHTRSPLVIRRPFRPTRIHSTLMDTDHISRAMMTDTTFHARKAHPRARAHTTRSGCESDALSRSLKPIPGL